jgi:hypothetical protein
LLKIEVPASTWQNRTGFLQTKTGKKPEMLLDPNSLFALSFDSFEINVKVTRDLSLPIDLSHEQSDEIVK